MATESVAVWWQILIIHDMNALPRLVETALADRLRVMPAVVVADGEE